MKEPAHVVLYDPARDELLDLGERVEVRVEVRGEWRSARLRMGRGSLENTSQDAGK